VNRRILVNLDQNSGFADRVRRMFPDLYTQRDRTTLWTVAPTTEREGGGGVAPSVPVWGNWPEVLAMPRDRIGQRLIESLDEEFEAAKKTSGGNNRIQVIVIGARPDDLLDDNRDDPLTSAILDPLIDKSQARNFDVNRWLVGAFRDGSDGEATAAAARQYGAETGVFDTVLRLDDPDESGAAPVAEGDFVLQRLRAFLDITDHADSWMSMRPSATDSLRARVWSLRLPPRPVQTRDAEMRARVMGALQGHAAFAFSRADPEGGTQSDDTLPAVTGRICKVIDEITGQAATTPREPDFPGTAVTPDRTDPVTSYRMLMASGTIWRDRTPMPPDMGRRLARSYLAQVGDSLHQRKQTFNQARDRQLGKLEHKRTQAQRALDDLKISRLGLGVETDATQALDRARGAFEAKRETCVATMGAMLRSDRDSVVHDAAAPSVVGSFEIDDFRAGTRLQDEVDRAAARARACQAELVSRGETKAAIAVTALVSVVAALGMLALAYGMLEEEVFPYAAIGLAGFAALPALMFGAFAVAAARRRGRLFRTALEALGTACADVARASEQRVANAGARTFWMLGAHLAQQGLRAESRLRAETTAAIGYLNDVAATLQQRVALADTDPRREAVLDDIPILQWMPALLASRDWSDAETSEVRVLGGEPRPFESTYFRAADTFEIGDGEGDR